MSFRQQLAKNSVNVHQAWLDDIKNKFMQECEKASRSGRLSCCKDYAMPQHWCAVNETESIRQQLQKLLVELGFPEGKVTSPGWQGGHYRENFRISVQWSHEDATCTVSPPQTTRGTCTTCPICQETRPAVALMPCGHVICRDCHRCQQLRQCPMCRGPITSATEGLFMD